MDISNREMLNILHNLSEIFDKNNCEHLQLLIYFMYLNDGKDEEINQLIEQLILKTKVSNDIVEKENCCKPIDLSHPYPLENNISEYFISHKFQDFLHLI